MDVVTICSLVVLHFIADFVFQSRKMGREKSERFKVLLDHIFVQLIIFEFGLLLLGFTWHQATVFGLLNALVHGLIDWNVWRLYKCWVIASYVQPVRDAGYKKEEIFPLAKERALSHKYWEDHTFYLTIGFDQLLHALTLVILAHYFLS
jgi:hypothetical protein